MQQKHKKKHHPRPIVHKHAAAPTGAKSTASTTQQQQQQKQKQKQHQQHHNGQHMDHSTNGTTQQAKGQLSSLLGKRQHAAQQQDSTACKPPQQPGHAGVSMQHQGRQNKKQKLQDAQQAGNSLKQLQPQPKQQEGNDKRHHHSGNGRQSAVHHKGQQLRHKQQWTGLQELQQPQQHRADSQQQQPPAQHPAKRHQQHGKKRKHTGQSTPSSKPATSASGHTNGACGNIAGPETGPCSEAAATAAGPGCAAPAVAAAASPTAPIASSKPWHPKQPTAIGSNWQALQQQLKQQAAAQPRWRQQRKDPAPGDKTAANGASSSRSKQQSKQISALGHNKAVTPIVAMDCEMVGVGPGGERDSLARVSIVNASGNVLYDSYVGQREPVTDYRTWVSGILPANLVGAPDISTVQKQVTELLQGRVLVGHGLKKDLSVLMLSHPRKHIRDTAKYPPFMFSKGGKRRPRALKQLAQQELGLSIQEGQHSSIDDARAALYLYQQHAGVWEKALKTPQGIKQLPTANRPLKTKRVESYSLRDVKDDPLADL